MYEVNLIKDRAVPRSRRLKRFMVSVIYFTFILVITGTFVVLYLNMKNATAVEETRKKSIQSTIKSLRVAVDNVRDAQERNRVEEDDLRRRMAPTRRRLSPLVLLDQLFKVLGESRFKETTFIYKIRYDGPGSTDAMNDVVPIVIEGFMKNIPNDVEGNSPTLKGRTLLRILERSLAAEEAFRVFTHIDDASANFILLPVTVKPPERSGWAEKEGLVYWTIKLFPTANITGETLE